MSIIDIVGMWAIGGIVAFVVVIIAAFCLSGIVKNAYFTIRVDSFVRKIEYGIGVLVLVIGIVAVIKFVEIVIL